MQKIKVLLVSRRWYPDVIGGGQISAHKIACALANAGAEVLACTFKTEGERSEEIIDGIRIVRMPIKNLKQFPRLSNLEWMYREMSLQTEKIANEFKPDVIHALNGESVPSVAKVSKKTGIPFFVTVNGPLLFCFTQEGVDSQGNNCMGCRGRQRFRETIKKWGQGGPLSKIKAFMFWLYSYPHMSLFWRSCMAADMMFTVSNGIKERLIQINYPAEKLLVVHNPIGINRKVKSNVKKNLGIAEKEKVLLFAGRITENKGVQNMLRMLPSLQGTHVIVAGKGDYVAQLQQLASELKVSERVHFVGFIQNESLTEYYSVADVVIMAGTFYELLGRMLMEASSYGVPAIATKIGGTPEVIEDGKNGYLLKTQSIDELLEKTTKILNSKDLAEKMGTYGKQKMAREFSPEIVAQKILNAYKQALDKRLIKRK